MLCGTVVRVSHLEGPAGLALDLGPAAGLAHMRVRCRARLRPALPAELAATATAAGSSSRIVNIDIRFL